MKTVAVHGANGMARRWPNAIRESGLGFRPVNGYSNTIIDDLRDCDALLWHVDQDSVTDLRFARSVLLSAAELGLLVYPNQASVWHFDDKVAQKYLLSAIGAPLAQTWVFFDRSEALSFVDHAIFPLVFKLRGGAGSRNVRLLRSRGEAVKMIDQMFGKGATNYPVSRSAVEALRRVRQNKRDLNWLLRNSWRVGTQFLRRRQDHCQERGYILFQEFIEGNDHDTRVVIIGRRAFVWQRQVRPSDFRASGYGQNTYPDAGEIDIGVVEVSFDIARRLRSQTLALDFVRDMRSGASILLEVSYATIPELVESCNGFLDDKFRWHPGRFDMAKLILHDLLSPDASV